MAENKPSTKKPGRPKGAAPLTPEQKVARALNNLQTGLDNACKWVHDGQSSLAVRARRAAKRGIPRETVDAAVTAVEAALTDLKNVVNTAYAPRANGGTTKPASRVVLTK